MTRLNKPATVTVAVIVICLLAYEYPLLRFRGDGWIWGAPGFGYDIKMRHIPFNQAGEYVFHFRGIPDVDMTLLLYAEGKTYADRKELTDLGTTLDALLVDQRSHVICQGSGSASGEQNDRSWVLMSSYSEAAYWHWKCTDMPLKPSASYTLTLRIKNVDPRTPNISLIPVLEGGGPDWI
jgi:hypothetical protein